MNESHFVLLDSARMNGFIYQAMDMNEHHRCLYEGDSKVMLGSVAPYLFELDRQSQFAEWLVERGSGNSWGILIQSEAEAEELYHHFRHFLIVQTEEDKELYFRYYDPRVLRVFLPTCDAEQLEEIFGPIDAYIMEDEEGQLLHFSLVEGELEQIPMNCKLKEFMDSSLSISEHLEKLTKEMEGEGSSDSISDRWRMD